MAAAAFKRQLTTNTDDRSVGPAVLVAELAVMQCMCIDWTVCVSGRRLSTTDHRRQLCTYDSMMLSNETSSSPWGGATATSLMLDDDVFNSPPTAASRRRRLAAAVAAARVSGVSTPSSSVTALRPIDSAMRPRLGSSVVASSSPPQMTHRDIRKVLVIVPSI